MRDRNHCQQSKVHHRPPSGSYETHSLAVHHDRASHLIHLKARESVISAGSGVHIHRNIELIGDESVDVGIATTDGA